MPEAPYKIVATADNFPSAVLDASFERPVLVDFWAPWCGPCRVLMPMLDRIADDYGGRMILAKVNTDEEQELAAQYAIRSIPTVMLFRNGKPVEQFVGVQPETAVRALLDRHAGEREPGVAEEARALARRGDPAGARRLIERALEASPDDGALLGELAALQLEARDAAGADATLARLEAVAPEDPRLPRLRALQVFASAANSHPDAAALRRRLELDAADHEARHALAAHHALAGDFATALTEWLELLRRDRRYGEDLARRSLLAAFDLLGPDDELVGRYRRKMASLLH